MPTPALYPDTELSAVVAFGPNDVWAAGHWVTQDYVGVGLAKIVTLILHWDGTGWRVVPSPNDPASTSGSMLTALAASGPSDIWAIGQVDDWTTGVHGPLILHWDGARWSNIPTGDLGPGVKLYGVGDCQAGDAWVVGDGTYGGRSTPLIAHWDGRTWTRRVDAGDRGYLTGVVAISADDAWAVGTPGLISHWDGHAWSAPPDADGPQPQHLEINCSPWQPLPVTTSGQWAAASVATPLLPLSTLHWDGARWEALPNVTQIGRASVRTEHFASVAAAGRERLLGGRRRPDRPLRRPLRRRIPTQLAIHPCGRSARPGGAATSRRYEHTLRGVFLAYWRTHGGLAQFGYPLTERSRRRAPPTASLHRAVLRAGALRVAPEHAGTPSEVLLGLLGRTVTAERTAEAPFASSSRGPAGRGAWFPADAGTTWRRSSRLTGRRTAGCRSTATRSARPSARRAPPTASPTWCSISSATASNTTPNCPTRSASALVYSASQVLQARGWIR